MTTHQPYFIASLLEYAYKISPYNFDIVMSLVKLYDMLGVSNSFMTSHSDLDLKGVLLESIGFL